MSDKKAIGHRISVSISDPNHPMVSHRKDRMHRVIRVLNHDDTSGKALDFKDEAKRRARNYYQKQGYKVHDVEHHSEIKEMKNVNESRLDPNKATVEKKSYNWGKMVTVRHGNHFSIPLHPEHQHRIRELKDGEKGSIYDETGTWHNIHREGDKVHFMSVRPAKIRATVSHSHFTEEVEVNEVSKIKLARYVDKSVGDLADRRMRAGMNSKDFTNPDVEKNWHKSTNRMIGIRKAAEKMSGSLLARVKAAEETEVNEISKRLADKYVSAAVKKYDDVSSKQVKTPVDTPEYDKNDLKLHNRVRGIGLARNKRSYDTMNKRSGWPKVPATEETEVNEASEKKLTSYIKSVYDKGEQGKRRKGVARATDKLLDMDKPADSPIRTARVVATRPRFTSSSERKENVKNVKAHYPHGVFGPRKEETEVTDVKDAQVIDGAKKAGEGLKKFLKLTGAGDATEKDVNGSVKVTVNRRAKAAMEKLKR